jgi:heme-degrading monooxygenase HmoA
LHKTSAQIPDEDGNFHDNPSSEKVVVFMLGLKINHPMGIFTPHTKEFVDRLSQMIAELDKTAANSGFYGSSSWTNQDRHGATEFLILSHWRSTEDVHRFAYGPTHRETWDLWNKNVKKLDHIGINHEIYGVEKKNWESVYVNFQPTLMGATTYLKKGDKMIGGTIEDQWISPLVDTRKGKLRSSAGRLGREPTQSDDSRSVIQG